MRISNTLDAVTGWCVTIVFTLLPFFFLPVPWYSVAQSKVALVTVLLLIATVAWVVSRLIEGTLRTPALLAIGATALLPIAYLISSIVSGLPTISLFGSGTEQDTFAAATMWFAALAISAFAFSSNPGRLTLAVRSFLVGTLILEVLQVVHFALPSLSLGGAIVGQTGNAFGGWHDFAILLGFATFLSFVFLETPVSAGWWKHVVRALAVLSLLLLIIANFRDVWIALAAISLLYVLYQGHARTAAPDAVPSMGAAAAPVGQSQRKWWAVLIVAIFFAVFGGYVTNILPPAVRITAIEVRPSWQGTLNISEQALTTPKSLFFGAGPNTFTNEWGLYKPAEVNLTPFWNAEFTTGVASIPTAFVTVGIVGLLAWIATLAALLWVVHSVLFRGRGAGSPYMPFAQGLALGSIYLFAFFILYVPGAAIGTLSFLSFGALLALAGALGAVPVRTLPLRGEGVVALVRAVAVVVFAVAVGYASVGAGRVLASEAVLNRGTLAYNTTSDIGAASNMVNTAIKIAPDNDRAQRSAVQLGLLRLQQMMASADPNDAEAAKNLQSTLEQTIQHGLKAVSINSSGYQNWLELASLYQQLAGANVEGAYANAQAAYAKAFEGNPRNPLPLLQLAQLELLQNRAPEALQYLAAAIQLKQDFAPAYYLASQIYAAQNDFQNAGQAATLAVQYAQNDPLAWYNLGIIAYAAGDYVNAEGALQQAIARQPQYANALYMLGLSQYQQKKTDAALQTFVELDKLSPNQPEVQQIIENLRGGKPLFTQAPAQNQAQRETQRGR